MDRCIRYKPKDYSELSLPRNTWTQLHWSSPLPQIPEYLTVILIYEAMNGNSSPSVDTDRVPSFCHMCRDIVDNGRRWYHWKTRGAPSTKKAVYVHYQTLKALRSSKNNGGRTRELICLSLGNLAEEIKGLNRLIQELESKEGLNGSDFRDYDENSRGLHEHLETDRCHDDEDSALRAILYAYCEGTVVLIDRFGPTRWLDVKVLSSNYGQVQTDIEVTRSSRALAAADGGHAPVSDYVNISSSLLDETLLQEFRSWMAKCSLEHGICRDMCGDRGSQLM